MPQVWQGVALAAAMLFLRGRALFWRGYARGAPVHALGFALTFYPSDRFDCGSMTVPAA